MAGPSGPARADAIAASAPFGPANVVMQLALLPVGRGVAESTVDSGRVDKYPFKRQRTTASHLIVALLGTDEERRAMRSEVNRQHRQVRRREGEADVGFLAPEFRATAAVLRNALLNVYERDVKRRIDRGRAIV